MVLGFVVQFLAFADAAFVAVVVFVVAAAVVAVVVVAAVVYQKTENQVWR